jgi:hypothetical protein
LQFSVADELKLFDLLNALNTEIPGQFLLQQCAMTRRTITEADDQQPALTVDCNGAWLTFKHRAES